MRRKTKTVATFRKKIMKNRILQVNVRTIIAKIFSFLFVFIYIKYISSFPIVLLIVGCQLFPGCYQVIPMISSRFCSVQFFLNFIFSFFSHSMYEYMCVYALVPVISIWFAGRLCKEM